jgi:enoyl-CoA hydratase
MSTVHVERRGPVALVTLDRPKVNALNSELLGDLGSALDELAADTALRSVVVTGAGRAFVAGADIAEMQSLTALEAEAFSQRGQAVLDQLARLPVPVVAAVNGWALGGGCELAMACDIVLAGDKAVFGQPEVKLGVIPGFGGTQRLVRRVGLTRALDLCLTGRNVVADEAVSMGLAARKVDGDVVEAALAVAAEIAGWGPVAVRLCKRALHENADADLSTGLAAERTLFGLCFATADQAEGMDAFLNKRNASWTGR